MTSFKWRTIGILLAGTMLPACGVSGGATLTPTVAPGIPASLIAAAGNKQATIRWSSPSNGVTFTVKRSLTSGGPYFPISVPGQFLTPTSYVDSGLANGTTYYYVVAASNQFGLSSDSAEVQATPGFRPLSVASGEAASHCLAILPDRTAWAWGDNRGGQLGNGRSSGQSDTPVEVVTLREVTAVAAGSTFSLALTSDGTVWAWGNNTYGILGDGTTSNTAFPIPQEVPNLSGVVALAAGTDFALALKNDGTVWAWGKNNTGQLGLRAISAPVPAPAPVTALAGVKAIAAAEEHSVVVLRDGSVWGWGTNVSGEAGTGSTSSPVSTPTQVQNLTSVISVVAGFRHCLALRSDGTVYAWGWNQNGQVGTGTASTTPILRATKVANLSEVTSVAAGWAHSYAVRLNGEVWSWGNAVFGQLGNGTDGNGAPDCASAVRVLNTNNIVAITSAQQTGFCVDDQGAVRAWGLNSCLGNGMGETHDLPVSVPNVTNVTAISSGVFQTIALRGDGTVWGWGTNSHGEVGFGSVGLSSIQSPGQVPTPPGMIAVATGFSFSMALCSDGTVWAWGDNTFGEMGQGAVSSTPTTAPVKVTNLTNVIAIAAESCAGFALRNDGTVWQWGDIDGPLGPATPNPTPAPVVGLSNVTMIKAGYGHALALRSDGTVWAWGWNNWGQLGIGSLSSTTTPTQVLNLAGVTAISGGYENSLAVRNDGSVWEWGYMQSDAGLAQQTTPVQWAGIAGATEVSASFYFNLALMSDGSIWSWGVNDHGQLGTGDETSQWNPVPALPVSGVTALSAGEYCGVAILPDRTVRAWGWNSDGQLGVPLLQDASIPVLIAP
jgi:alpha-tubulin suppressor-like RCC1 family protein